MSPALSHRRLWWLNLSVSRGGGGGCLTSGFFIIGSKSGVNVASRHESIANLSAWPHCLIEESANGILDVCVCACACRGVNAVSHSIWLLICKDIDCDSSGRMYVYVWESASICRFSPLTNEENTLTMLQVHLRTCFLYLDGHLVMSVPVWAHVCVRACMWRGVAVNQMSPYSMLVLAEAVGVLARC